jgi:hypothetical protein
VVMALNHLPQGVWGRVLAKMLGKEAARTAGRGTIERTMTILGVELAYIGVGLCVIWMVGSALLLAWLAGRAPIDPPWGK